MAHEHAPAPVTALSVSVEVLEVARLGEALGFYCGALGGALDDTDGVSAVVRFADGRLVLREVGGVADTSPVRVAVADAGAARDALLAVALLDAQGGLTDPDGRRVELEGRDEP